MISEQQKVINQSVLGIELGSTRIKAVLIDEDNKPIAQAAYSWENKLENGLWTYSINDIWHGIQICYSRLRMEVKSKYNSEIETLSAIGISAMMHGYMVFNKNKELLVPFRTWRNTNTSNSASVLSNLFSYNIPLRWSIAHLYQAILNNEEHVHEIDFLTTLSGYIHWQITGEKVLGIGDASGIFPIDSLTKDYSPTMIKKFENLIIEKNYKWKLSNILPKILVAGENGGFLLEEGAKKLDVSGHLKPGIPVCPPEGDAGTGMVATNSIKPCTGSVSVGTSSFSMIVLEKDLSQHYKTIDIVATPEGNSVAMVHSNNCTSELNSWINIFADYNELMGISMNMDEIYDRIYKYSLKGDPDCGGLISYNYLSGEPITGMDKGCPLFMRLANSRLNLANFIRCHLYSSICILKIGNDILFNQEGVKIREIMGHGGFFKTKGVGQQILADAINIPISVMETAGEGGAWGIALLASYMVNKSGDVSLADYLDNGVFKGKCVDRINPSRDGLVGFAKYMELYKRYLPVEAAAIKL